MLIRKLIPLLIILTLLSGCTVTTPNLTESADPYEHFNRNTYRLNEKLDTAILKPTAKAYNYVTPRFVRQGVSNFFNNLNEIPAIINDVLQGRVYWTLHDFWRFTINTTIGIGGIFDVAKAMGLTQHDNNFGLTLSTWGAKPSPYFMMPLLGPSTLTDFNGMIFDIYFSPWTFGPQPFWVSAALFGGKVINTRAILLKNENLMNQVAIDRYAFIRSAYMQYRAHQFWLNTHPPIDGDNSDEEYSDSDTSE